MKKEETKVQELEVKQDTLIRVMRRIGDPTMIPNQNMPTIYNVMHNTYADPRVKFKTDREPGFGTVKDLTNQIFRQRREALMYNIKMNVVYTLEQLILSSNEMSSMTFRPKSNNYDSRLDPNETNLKNILYGCLECSLNYYYFDIEKILSNDSQFYNLETIVNTALSTCYSINNVFYKDLIKGYMLSEESNILIVDSMGRILDYIVYIYCLMKYEAICIYNNASTSMESPLQFVNNAPELLEYMYNYDKTHRQDILYKTTVEMNNQTKLDK